MYCKNCGNKLKEGAAFCSYCGMSVDVAPESSVLPKSKKSSRKKSSGVWLLFCALIIIMLARLLFMQRSVKEEQVKSETTEESETTGSLVKPIVEMLDNGDEKSVEEAAVKEAREGGSDEETDAKREEKTERTEDILKEEEIHTYELIVADVSWTEAYNECVERGGYLVRINSAMEREVILQQIEDEEKENIKFWIGGARSDEDSYTYQWVYEGGNCKGEALNGEEKYAAFWLENEPSYRDETTEVTEMYLNMFYMSSLGRWVWNDAPNDIIEIVPYYSGTVGYVCEYD